MKCKQRGACPKIEYSKAIRNDRLVSLREGTAKRLNTAFAKGSEGLATRGKAPADLGNALAESGNVPTTRGNLPADLGNLPTKRGKAPATCGNPSTELGNVPATLGNAIADLGRIDFWPVFRPPITSRRGNAPVSTIC